MVGKMALLVTVVTSGLAQVFIFSLHWPIAVMVISSRGLKHVDPSRRDRTLRPGAAGAVIAIISIAPTFLVVSARSFQGLSLLKTMKRHGSCLLGAERKRTSVPEVFLVGFEAERWLWG